MDYAGKAQELATRADKRLKSFSLFGGNKYEEAADMYEKAANQFKLAKACAQPWGRWAGGGGASVSSSDAHANEFAWRKQQQQQCKLCRASRNSAALLPPPLRAAAVAARSPHLPKLLPSAHLPSPHLHLHLSAGNDAGETFVKLADVHLKLESRHDAASAWVEAAKSFLKSDRRRELQWPAAPPGVGPFLRLACAGLVRLELELEPLALHGVRDHRGLAAAPASHGRALPAAAAVAGSVGCLQHAVSLYTDMGRLGMAARQLRVRRRCCVTLCLLCSAALRPVCTRLPPVQQRLGRVRWRARR